MFHFIIASLLAAPAFAFDMPPTDYQFIAASQTNASLGPNGKKGDILERIVVIPDTTAAGTVILSDGSGLSHTIFVSGTLADLKPVVIQIGMRSVSGSWNVTTGANVHVLAVGRFD